MNTPHDQGAREARYAEAINHTAVTDSAELLRDLTDAVLAVADAEQAELRAEVERLRQAGESLAAQGFEALDRADSAEAELRSLRDALSVAEDTLRALREGIRAAGSKLARLIEYVEDECDSPSVEVCHDHVRTDDGECALVSDLSSIRALLAPSPATTTGEGGVCGGSVHSFALGGSAPCARPRGHEGDHRPGFIVHETTLPAPVSSGEAGTVIPWIDESGVYHPSSGGAGMPATMLRPVGCICGGEDGPCICEPSAEAAQADGTAAPLVDDGAATTGLPTDPGSDS